MTGLRWKWAIWLVAVVVVSNVILRASDRRIFLGKRVTNGWILEGDLIYPTWEPDLDRYADKVLRHFRIVDIGTES